MLGIIPCLRARTRSRRNRERPQVPRVVVFHDEDETGSAFRPRKQGEVIGAEVEHDPRSMESWGRNPGRARPIRSTVTGRRQQVFLDRLLSKVRFASGLAEGPFFFMPQPMDRIDLAWICYHLRIFSFDGSSISLAGAAGKDGCFLRGHPGHPFGAATD